MGAKKAKRFWCRWEAPESIPTAHISEKWPDGMYGWISGYGDGYQIWCAVVTATTPEQANDIVLSCYGKSAKFLTMSWEPQEKLTDWLPGDRFPLPKGLTL